MQLNDEGGGASMHPYKVLEGNEHAKADLLSAGLLAKQFAELLRQKCFAQFEANEARLCGEWAVFYHSCACLFNSCELAPVPCSMLQGTPSQR